VMRPAAAIGLTAVPAVAISNRTKRTDVLIESPMHQLGAALSFRHRG